MDGPTLSNLAAAWVQAVGSVLAIGAAIAIDQGTTRRAQRAAARAHAAAVAVRVNAVRQAAVAIDLAADQLADAEIPANGWFKFSETVRRELSSSLMEVRYYLGQDAAIERSVLVPLLHAENLAYRAVNLAGDDQKMIRPADQAEVEASLRNCAEKIRDLQQEHGTLP